ncbi:Ldi domain-containing protein [Fusarium falciforme]|uniref:Ldi domain-containing protein n=1 Tax=Fusarium falciforme TaxID=195108 RepID=UPI0023006F83|nr:Ldi domain-containing protein [Fusarium falciforme]WAO91159.1 Ldi domain-containing protein [Fusarium falciforme]
MTVESSKPSFSLVDHNCRPVHETDFRGNHTLIFFGFTHCAVVCPRALERLTEILSRLGTAANRFNALYISVDPERDTPEVMKTFLSSRAPYFTGLTGTKGQVDSARKAFRVFAQRKNDDSVPEGYTIPHTAITYILGPDGRLVDHLNDSLDIEEAAMRLHKVLALDSNGGATSAPAPHCLSPGSSIVGQESLALLDKKQAASIRHIGNLARQLKGDWSNMMGPTDLNDGFGAYRFQIAYGAYTLALAHFHRLPAAPGVFKPTLERMIEKMCHPDVWYYWRDASTGGGVGNTPRKEPDANPIEKDNIMYSSYLQTMTLLYNSLFDDDRYTKPGSLTLEYDPFFWGDAGGFRFEYDQNSLNDRVYWNMVESGYLGVACEPYCVFQICNQPPIIGFRLNDELHGGKTAEEVTTGYVKAWKEFGGSLDAEGGYQFFVGTHNNMVVPSPGTGMDAWCALLMHSWNPDFVKENYDTQRQRSLIHHEDGTLSVKVNLVEGMSKNTTGLLKSGEFGWMIALAAEVGDTDTLNRLLAYADKHFSPRYQNGGLTYPRRDDMYDDDGYYVMSTPMQSNALFPLARLNVSGGFERLYKQPWGPKNREHYDEPALTEIDFSIDVYRAVYIPTQRALLFDVAAFEEGARGVVGLARVFGRGNWTLKRDGSRIAWGSSTGLSGSEPLAEIKQDGEVLLLSHSETRVTSFVIEWA